MKQVRGYAATALIVVLAVIGALAMILDAPGVRGVVLAGVIAYPVQVLAFWLLVRYRSTVKGFLAVWVGGTLARLVIIGLAAVWAARSDADVAPIPMLLALAGFFFGLLLIEPVFFRSPGETTTG